VTAGEWKMPSSSSLYTQLISGALFPLHERLKGHQSVALRRELERSQWWSADELNVHRVRRLREFLIHAGKHVPYYRGLFGRIGFDPLKLTSLQDIAGIPLLDKQTIRANIDVLRSEGASSLTPFNTGGSTGEPLTFYLTRERVSHDVAAKWRATRWWDVDIGDPEAVIWGSPIELGGQDRIKAVRDRLLRTRLFPAFNMSAASMDAFLGGIRRMRPRMLFGYPSALALLARHADERGVPMNDLGIRVAFVTGERLDPEQRETISRIFGCPVANGYGGRDAGFIAHECPSGGMHLSAEDIIVEVIDEGGKPQPPGTAGELVVTHLCTGDFPFLRYRTGDIGTLSTETCACGRTLPLLSEVQGRSTDFVVAADGTLMHGLALIYVVRGQEGVSRFRIIQESIDRTRVELVPDGALGEEIKQRIIDGFRERLGEGVQVDVETVPEIPPERSGKYRYVISHAISGQRHGVQPSKVP